MARPLSIDTYVADASRLRGVPAELPAAGAAAAKSLGLDSGGGKAVAVWIIKAGWTYPLFGAVAGLVSGAALFRFKRSETRSDERDDDQGIVPSRIGRIEP